MPTTTSYIEELIDYDFISIRDLKDAFRQLMLATRDRFIYQYSIFGHRFGDKRQAYGIASAAANCQRFARVLIWIFNQHYVPSHLRNQIKAYIDDYTLVAKTEIDCLLLSSLFDKMCEDLHVQISTKKNKDAIQKGILHGFSFNLITKMVWMPDMKHENLMNGMKIACFFAIFSFNDNVC